MYEGSQIQERKDTVTNKDGKAFCIDCGRSTRYETGIGWDIAKIRGVTYISYLRLTARCGVCGNEVYVPEVNDANVKARECAYKQIKDTLNCQSVFGNRKELKE